jgi:hypothetical protein
MQVLEQSRVRHRVFGEGTIIDQRHYGHEFLVRFPNSLHLWIKKNNLTFLDLQPAGEPVRPAQAARQPRPQIKPELRIPREARSVIEAFRLGIIPVQAIREWKGTGKGQAVAPG